MNCLLCMSILCVIVRRLTLKVDNRMTGQTVMDTHPDVTSYRLNRSYDFVGLFDGSMEVSRPHTSEIFVACRDIGDIARSFHFFGRKGLHMLCDFMTPKIEYSTRTTIKEMILSILLACAHISSSKTKIPVLIFKERNYPRELNDRDMRVLMLDDLQLHAQESQKKGNKVKATWRKTGQREPISSSVHAHQVANKHTHPSISRDQDSADFPYILTEERKRSLISRWQQSGADAYKEKACAVCGKGVIASQISVMHADNLDLALLRNSDVVNNQRLVPKTYNFDAYDGAILYHGGLITPGKRGYMQICGGCKSSLDKKKQPLDSWANYQYYGLDCLPGDVAGCLDKLSDFDKMMICRARASKITHLYDERKGVYEEEGTSRGFNRGNVGILPQDTAVLRNILPPNLREIEESACAIFINSKANVNRESISSHHPVLVSKNNIKTMLEFLAQNNPAYSPNSGLELSEDNLNSLYNGDEQPADLPPSIEVRNLGGHVQASGDASREAVAYTNSESDEQSDEIVMEAVGYTTGDFSRASYKYMKGVALDACLNGQKFIQVRTGPNFTDDEDLRFLTHAFPHLDPWGIGGFNLLSRKKKQTEISFERQLKNMLQQHNRHFVKDPTFAYVCWNILQKREMRECIAFKTSERRRHKVTEELYKVQPGLQSMIQKWKRSPMATPETELEKRAVKMLSMVRMISKDAEGSAGYKQCRRNEIRSLMKKYGTPALFVTLTPDDKTNELVGVLGGIENSEWYSMSEMDRKRFVAKYPDLAARAFDITMRKFIDIILKPDDRKPGAFGRCSAYYGMVEAQGRGMLHCHFLIWLEGNLNPQQLRDRMSNDKDFKAKMFEWLEATIKCQLPDDKEVIEELNGPLPRPLVRNCASDISCEQPPYIDELSEYDFNIAFNDHIKRLVEKFNWHEHCETCWKYLLPGDPRDDSTCRMRMNGSTNQNTYVDDETGSIILKRLHPRISNYNELLTFLIRSNVDIKYIGSGEAAKALVFYVTDYITKSELPVHEGLTAIQLAMEKTEKQYSDTSCPSETRSRSLLIKSLNAIMGRVELSHQQVMSYLIGGGDVYSSHKFRTVIWSDVEQYLKLNELDDNVISADIANNEQCDDTDGVYCGEEMVNIDIDSTKRISTSNLVRDYALRDEKSDYENLCLYDYMARVYKTKDVAVATKDWPVAKHVGRFQSGHPQMQTHILHLRQDPNVVVPVILGRRIPRPEIGDEEYEEWCRTMLALFKPWRSKEDLKHANEPWSSAFYRTQFDEEHYKVMTNIHVENECRDARDAHSAAYYKRRHCGRTMCDSGIETRFISDIIRENDEYQDIEGDERNDGDYVEGSGHPGSGHPEGDEYESELCHLLFESGIMCSKGKERTLEKDVHGGEVTPSAFNSIHEHRIIMEKYRREKRPAAPQIQTSKRKKLNDGTAVPTTTIEQFPLDDVEVHQHVILPRRQTKKSEMRKIVDTIVEEYTMNDNEEQQRAFRIVAEHFISGTEEQLLMYVGGMGGTGKSHVIKAIVELFKRCGYPEHLLVSAPTGCAAVLINGYTIHALTFLPSSKVKLNVEDLQRIWHDVRYLIVDEVSMISAYFLGQISDRLCRAKVVYDNSCGGINIIFFGDLGQLPPVGSLPLFSRELVKELAPKIKETYRGQVALRGAFIWRHIKEVVLLKKNQRAKKDPKFANLLRRVRLGLAWDGYTEMTATQLGTGNNYSEADEMTLRSRDLRTVMKQDENAREKFKNAPIIVTNRRERDCINIAKARQYANSTGKELNEYHSRDWCRKVRLEGRVQERVWQVPSTRTQDALGKLPLVVGMKVMITENVAMMAKVVNGAEGHLVDIKWELDALGRRYAQCAYVEIKGSNVKLSGLDPDVIPIFPVKTYFKFRGSSGEYPIVREQLPMVPAYAFTDYKSQGRTLDAAIVDLSNCRDLQSVYVMLSRCRRLEDLVIVRGFRSKKINSRLSEEFRNEFYRLDVLDRLTKSRHERHSHSRSDTSDIFTVN
jgi:hypothetical protein